MIIATSGADQGFEIECALESAFAHPRMTFGVVDFYYNRAEGSGYWTPADLKPSFHRW